MPAPVFTLRVAAGTSSGSAQRKVARKALMVIAAAVGATNASAQVVISEWNIGNGAWNIASNWLPNGIPENGGGFTYDVRIGSRPIAANAQVTYIPNTGTTDSVSTLTISNGADLLTNSRQLNVLSQVTIDGAGSTIRVDVHSTPATPSLLATNLDLNNGGGLALNSGTASISTLMEINAGSVLQGYGYLSLGDADGVVEQAFENSGLIQMSGTSLLPGVTTLHANGVDTIDLDGDSELGVVDISNAVANANQDTLTLIVDGPLADSFGAAAGSALQIGQRDTITFNQDFQISAGATVDMDGGNNTATLNGPGNITSIAGATFNIAGDAVIANDMTFTGTANVVSVAASSTLELNGTVSMPDASALAMALTSTLIIGGTTSVTEAAGDFNWDGAGAATTTIQGTGQLNLSVNRIDTTDDVYGGTLNLNDDGDVSVIITGTSWTMAGTLNKNGAGTSVVTGDAVNVTGDVNVNAGTLNLPLTTLSPGATVVANGTLTLGGASTFAGPNSVSGSGFLRMVGTSTVSANTTIAVNAFDWDGSGTGTTHTINNGIVFTINSPVLDTDGDMDDPISLGGNGAQLIVNGPAQWGMTGVFIANAAALGTATIGGTSRMSLTGTMNVNGFTTADAPLTFASGSTVNIASLMGLRLSGGTLIDTNLIAGATISGLGVLQADAGSGLNGSGTISTPVDFDGTASLKAAGGVLTISGTLVDVGTLGTAAVDGTLNIPAAWNSNIADNVNLSGGTLAGGAITIGNVNGITGNGLVSAKVLNSTRMVAQGGTLVVETAVNDNDWDGAGGAGLLVATAGSTLEIRDNATFPFTGTVTALGGGTVYTRGFGMNFNAGSTINLTASTLKSDESTSISGAVVVGAGTASTIDVQVNRFLTLRSTSNTTLNGDLRLVTNNGAIEAGATFSGTGAIVVPAESHLILEANANVTALLELQGNLRPAGFNAVGRVDVKDYQQSNTGALYVELTGTALNQYDRVVVNGTAVLDGYLNVDIDGGFVPALGNTFNVLTASGGVIGTFDYKDVSGMPPGLTFHVNYLGNAVQLQVVNTPFYSADFDDDGDVDQTDLAIWKGAFNLNQLGDADGDLDTDYLDWILWREQFGAQPGPLPGTVVIPEPGSFAVLLGAFGLSGLRRRQRTQARNILKRGAMAILAGLLSLSAFTGESSAVPSVSVLNNGTVGGNRQWILKVTPDAALIAGGHGALAVELAFEVDGTELLSGAVNTTDWPYPLPGTNPFGGGTGSFGMLVNPANDTAYVTLGSNIFVSATPVTVGTLTTQGSGRGVVSWGGHTLTQLGGGTGSLVVQGSTAFKGLRGALPVGSVAGDANVDGKVNTVDFNLIAGHFGLNNMDWSDGDFTQDNTVNSLDFNAFTGNYGQSIPAPAPLAGGVVPEPTTGLLLATAGGLLRRRSGR